MKTVANLPKVGVALVVKKPFEIGLIAAIVLAVASFGGTEPVSWAIVEAGVFLLGLWLVARPPGGLAREAKIPVLGPVALLLFIGAQWLGSYRAHLGFDPFVLRNEWLRLATYLVAFYASLAVCRARDSRLRLVVALVIIGLTEALYGLVQYLTGWEYILTYAKRYYVSDATGTYVNHNHFAGLLEMVLPLTLGLGLHWDQKVRRRPRAAPAAEFLERLGHPEMQKGILLLFIASVLFLAIVFSQSRMGLVACVMSLVAMASVLAAGRKGRAASAALILVLIVSGATFASWVGVDPIVARFELLPQNEGLSENNPGRLAIWEDTVHLLRNRPWTGVGLGCFEFAYTRYQTVWLKKVVGHAHNDYIELAADLGIPGAVLFFGMVFAVAIQALRAVSKARESSTQMLALGAFGGIVALLVHSLADFNLFIPANGLVFAVLLALGDSTRYAPPGANERHSIERG